MHVLKHDEAPLEKWREGVMTRLRVSALSDGRQLCIFDQFCDFDLGAPSHLHAVEEVLEVMDGMAEIWVGKERATVRTNQSVVVPAGILHGFKNLERGKVLHVRATLAAPIFEASYEAKHEVSRRWVPLA